MEASAAKGMAGVCNKPKSPELMASPMGVSGLRKDKYGPSKDSATREMGQLRLSHYCSVWWQHPKDNTFLVHHATTREGWWTGSWWVQEKPDSLQDASPPGRGVRALYTPAPSFSVTSSNSLRTNGRQRQENSAQNCAERELESKDEISVERLWLDYFRDPTLAWDNRRHDELDPKSPDVSTKESVLIDSCKAPKWVKKGVPGVEFGDRFKSGSSAGNAVVKRFPRGSESWMGGISQNIECGRSREALRSYEEMRDKGVKPKFYTFVAALKACSSLGDLEAGKRIHCHAIESGCELHRFVGTSLLSMYAKCGSMVDARRVFDKLPQQDVVSWNSIILGYAQNKEGELGLESYYRMWQEGIVPNARTFVGALKSCSTLAGLEEGIEVDGKLVKMRCLEKGKSIHAELVKSGFQSDVFVGSTLVDMYAKCGSIQDARHVFEKLPHRNVVSWNAMILGCSENNEGHLALKLFARMREEGVAANARTFVGALKACASLAALEEGREVDGKVIKIGCLQRGKSIHTQLASSGFESDVYVGTTLVDMYAKCGSMIDAGHVFDKLPHRNLVAWNSMIMGYAQNGDGELGLALYACMEQEGIPPDDLTFIGALRACGSLAALEEGREVDGQVIKVKCLEKGKYIHSKIVSSGFGSDLFVGTTLIDMYSKCGSTADARRVFENLVRQDVVAWNSMIFGYVQNGEGDLALQFYERMGQEGVEPDARTFVGALKACSVMEALEAQEEGSEVRRKMTKVGCLRKGKYIHSKLVSRGFESDEFVGAALVDMYVKCGSMADAQDVFDKFPRKDVVLWNSMILGYSQSGQPESALQLYARMGKEGVVPNARTFVGALKACGALAALEEGRECDGKIIRTRCLEKGKYIHSQLVKGGYESNEFVGSTLVDMYAKCGSMVDAQNVFDKLPLSDVVSWNVMLLGYAKNKDGDLALELYKRMNQEGVVPSAQTFVGMVKACISLAELEEGREIDGKVIKTRSLETGKDIHSEIVNSGFESDVFVGSSLVEMYAKCGSMLDARSVFDKLRHRDVVSWTAMILGYAQNGEDELALELYERMGQERVAPDHLTFIGALKACGGLAALEVGKRIHSQIHLGELEAANAMVATTLIDMYGKCGSMSDAQSVFDALSSRNLVTWNALVAGYVRHGQTEVVFSLFERMEQEGIQPDKVTFLSLLSMCSHAGLVCKGEMYFEVMSPNYGVIPTIEHYMCMIDLLGRAGQVDEAVAMVTKMPFQPNIVTCTTVLGACQKWNNVEIGRRMFDGAMRLDKKHPATYILMSNIYGDAHMWEERNAIQTMRKIAKAWKKPGQSWWTEIGGTMHTFTVDDMQHPSTKEIYATLKDLSIKMDKGNVQDSGLGPKSSSVV